jgi:hypothetical protein
MVRGPEAAASRVFFKIFSSCAGSHSLCESIYSEDTNLFRIMKMPTTEAPRYRKTALFRLPPWRSFGLLVPWSLVLLGLAACYRSNTLCYPIHSRDTHLFRIMKKTNHRSTGIPKNRSFSPSASHFSFRHGPLVFYSRSMFRVQSSIQCSIQSSSSSPGVVGPIVWISLASALAIEAHFARSTGIGARVGCSVDRKKLQLLTPTKLN